jgi:hypothetical protein
MAVASRPHLRAKNRNIGAAELTEALAHDAIAELRKLASA